ncbi:MAG: integrase [Hydrogenovibrio crunogenus]|uniref:Putative integrase n=1 Tax=Hydrogenovibrio crunogenus (strain DSM 25203 / XCL-2) TaxID=317025 RepID=Q31IU7_HYDCU|nr:integrase [Hydrogenovibrio crunogenus]
MPSVIQFIPRAERDASKNLEDFISTCKRQLTVFGADLNWSDWKWPKAANFTKVGVKSRSVNPDSDLLAPEFMDFAKAYFRYQQGHKPTVAKNEMRALRTIEQALLEHNGSADISKISISVLDEAVVVARQSYEKMASYHAGREIERLAKFVSDKNLVPEKLDSWKNPIKRANDRVNTGQKAKSDREKKLPSSDVLEAMAEIFASNPDNPRDIFTSSVFAMLMCAPSRIAEILLLPVDCEVEEKDSQGDIQYGWRFYSGKGFGGDIKWIPKVMVPIAKEAIARIKSLTAPARDLAKWIEDHPRSFYPHTGCPKVDSVAKLTAIEAAIALGFVARDKASAQTSLAGMKLKSNDYSYSLDELWNDYVMLRQPDSFPWLSKEQDIKYSNALFCMTKNLLHEQRGNSPVILWAPTNNVFNNDLSPRESLKRQTHQSIFDRYGYKDAQGNRLKATSHQMRHLLSTIAERGGMAQDELAKWAGRADAKQNRVYNQMSEFEMVVRAEQFDPSKSLFGPVGEAKKHIPVTIQEFNTLEKGTAHVTEYGFCVHDYTISPCDKYRDCLNCAEQVCVKGEDEKLLRIKAQLAEVEEQFKASETAINEGLAGADRWHEYHQHTFTHLKQLVEILEDHNVPDGALIKLSNDKSFSQTNRVLRNKHGENKLKQDQQKLAEQAKALLGGGLG